MRNRSSRKRNLLLVLAGLVAVVLIAFAFGVGGIIPLAKARGAIAARDYERARWWISTSQFLAPDSGDAEFLLARIARHEDRLDEMRQHLRNAEKLGIDRQRLRREEMLVLANQGQLDGVEEELRRWLAAAEG